MTGDDGRWLTIAVAQAGTASPAALVTAVAETPPGVDLVVLPYLGAIPYLPASLDRAGYRYAERSPSSTVAAVVTAARANGISVAVSAYEAVGEGVFYSTLTLITAGGVIQDRHRQLHGVNRPGYHEQVYFQPGITEPGLSHVAGVKIGWLLGGDLWVPEAARLLTLAGAEAIICLVAALETEPGLVTALARARAVENGRAVLVACRSGPGLTGQSILVHPNGEVIAESDGGQASFVVELDLADFASYSRRYQPLRWRQPRCYAPLVRFDEEA